MKTTVSIGDNYLDSRDLEERIIELQDLIEDGAELTEDDAEELKLWLALKEECEGYGWDDGIQFIRDSFFTQYTEELCNDIGAVNTTKGENWWIVIDWEATAENVKMDYTLAEIGDETYYYREA